MGINPLKYKVMAFAIGASTAGFAGVVTASQSNIIFPSSFTLSFSINILVLVIFGGMGSIVGVVVGAIIIQTVVLVPSALAALGLPAAGPLHLPGRATRRHDDLPSGGSRADRNDARREIEMAEAGEGHMDEVLTGDTP